MCRSSSLNLGINRGEDADRQAKTRGVQRAGIVCLQVVCAQIQ
jgi:hypothetical protein